jgi:hypothetical protein
MRNLIITIIALDLINMSLNCQPFLGFIGGLNYSKIHETEDPSRSDEIGKYRSFNSFILELNYTRKKERLVNYVIAVSYISRDRKSVV